jgi:transposase
MERSEAEAIYGSGREQCVEVMLELAGAVERLTARCERLEERIRRLEEQLRRDSRNSSAPPSQDPPKTRAERRAEARERAKAWAKQEGERKRGGQAGHPGWGRELLAEDQLDEIVDYYPDACCGCGREFSDEERRAGGRFGRHQVAELPPIAVTYSEHRTHHLRCPGCGKKTVAQLPEGLHSRRLAPTCKRRS